MVSTLAIERLWLHIIAYRIWRYNQRNHAIRKLEDYVALEIKVLKAKAIAAAGHLDRFDT
jgi:hypothetical protein